LRGYVEHVLERPVVILQGKRAIGFEKDCGTFRTVASTTFVAAQALPAMGATKHECCLKWRYARIFTLVEQSVICGPCDEL
jgi:hypothetical protein